MKHTFAWRMSLLIVFVATACAPATPTAALTTTAPAIHTAAVSATVTSAIAQAALGRGDVASDFSLTDSKGNLVDLASVTPDHTSTVLVFYLSHT